MNKTPVAAQVRRSHPYLGLDYFREEDAALFFERDDDSRRCADTLLGFGVKILILQGSSGAGKSSFLRAGLVPYLKSHGEGTVYFLNDSDDDVIRCTSDPMKWIGRAVFAFSRREAALLQPAGAEVADETAPPCVPALGEALFHGPRKALAEAVLETLECLCNELPGQLMLVLDQAEEVLTQRDSDLNNESTAAFFYFLSEMYIRNIDVRIVVAMRTEYYGRFRDELDIRDDRLSSRPRHGGVASHLLRPIRNRDALIRIATAPARGEAASIYNYSFDPLVAARIVDDILKQERHGSVTPLLQAVCSVLYDDLGPGDRSIRLAQYERLGAIPGITRRYVETGFRAVLGPVDNKVLARWYHLLFSLVSRQGGGTLVSEIETVEELRTRADNLQISADVDGVLCKLCRPPSPLLRGQPPDRPTQFSLKHDILAGFFYRWKVEEDATLAQQKAEEERLRRVQQADAAAQTRIVSLVLLAAAALLGGLWVWNWHDRFETQIRDRLALAAEPPRSDYALSLLALLTAFDATNARNEQPLGFLSHDLRQETIAALRRALIRSPWFDGKFVAVGMNPEGDRAALLQEDGSIVELPLSPQAAAAPVSKTAPMALPPDAPKPRPHSSVATGYLAGLGPSVLIGRQLYYWSGGEPAEPVNLQDRWPSSLQRLYPQRYEFAGGALLVTGSRQGEAGENAFYRLRMTADDLLDKRRRFQKEELVARIGRVAPTPLFAESAGMDDTVAYLARAQAGWNGSDRSAADGSGAGRYTLRADRVGFGTLVDLPLPGNAAAHGNYMPYSPAFVLNGRAVLVSGPSTDFYWTPLPAMPPASPARAPGPGTISVAGLDRDTAALVPAKAYSPWAYSPLAAVDLPTRLRFAWLSSAGLWVADAMPVPNQPVKAAPVPGVPAPLLMGEPGGSKLRFNRTGDFLMLQQQPQYGGMTQVRVWNLAPAWSKRIAEASDQQLMDMACAALTQGPQEWKDAKAIGLFRLPGASEELCRKEA